MAHYVQTGLPENWARMTSSEKRDYRLDQFVNPAIVKFVGPDAEKAYKTRARRIADAFSVKEPDRLPVSLPVGHLPFNLYGIRMHDAIYDVEKGIRACQAFNEKYSDELDYFAAPFTIPGKALEILDYRLYAWPGHGLSLDAPDYQYVEGEYMKVEEYDDLIRDPSDFWLRTYLPRIFGAMDGFRHLSPLPDILEIPTAQLMPLALPQVRESLQRMIDAGEEIQKRNELSARLMEFGPANGFPSTLGMITVAPFDAIGDTLRGTRGIMMDMFRHPDKLLEAVEVMAELIIHSVLDSPRFADMLTVLLPLHKGADGWMSEKQFDTFYWPTLKKVMDAFIEEGLICMPFAEGSYNTRLETVTDFPEGSVVWWLDQTDMVNAKKILGSRFCIQGNVPASMVVTGSPAEIKEHCRDLIETCAPGGGYILAAGCIPDNPKLENIRAMHSAGKEYGMYRK